MTIINPRQEKAKRIFKAANLSVEWQNAWADFLKQKTRSGAKKVIKLGEQLLQEQTELGLSLKPRDSVRHRILVAEDYLSQQPDTPTHSDPQTQSLQEYLNKLFNKP